MITDYIIFAALLYLFFKGWSRGFFKALLGPICLAISCIAAFVYYQETHDITRSLLISIIGPLLLSILVSLGLKLWHKTILNKPPSLSFLSRLTGSIFSIMWGGCYLAIMLILIGIVPFQIRGLEQIQNDVAKSKSYTFLNRLTNNKIPATQYDIGKIHTLLSDPAKLKQFESTEEFKGVVENSRLRAIFTDKETTQQIQDKNYSQLLSNPKIQAVFQDPKLLEKMFELNKKIMEESLSVTPGETVESQPKWIEVE